MAAMGLSCARQSLDRSGCTARARVPDFGDNIPARCPRRPPFSRKICSTSSSTRGPERSPDLFQSCSAKPSEPCRYGMFIHLFLTTFYWTSSNAFTASSCPGALYATQEVTRTSFHTLRSLFNLHEVLHHTTCLTMMLRCSQSRFE